MSTGSEPPEHAADIGGGHRISFYVHGADKHLDAPPLLMTTFKDGDITVGIIDWHRNPAGEWCGGAVNFVNIDDRPVWQVESLDPLTITPSLLCNSCGSHGFIQNGRWVPA